PFTAGPSFLGSGMLLTIDAAGREIARTAIPEAGFLNGMVEAPDGGVLIADSARAQVLYFDPEDRSVAVWYSDPQLAPSDKPFLPGVNGLKIVDGALVLSSSAARTLYQLALSPNGLPQGSLTPLATGLPGADDFAPLPEGGFLLATHRDRVVRVGADGAVATVSDDPRLRGATAVALVGEGAARRAVVLGTGGFSEGLKEDAVVLSIAFPQP
ncbi:MAG: hypothetical protein K2Q06_08220, partial [Parvularculaceae bacterium]|nr:hypothetical protein [Parvularculaceae bacterium]